MYIVFPMSVKLNILSLPVVPWALHRDLLARRRRRRRRRHPLGWGGVRRVRKVGRGNKNGQKHTFWKRDMSQNSRNVFFARKKAPAGMMAPAKSLYVSSQIIRISLLK